MMYDIVIIGGGIVGFSAAIYAGRFHLKTLVLGENFGGTMLLTDELENYPGFEKISGADLFGRIKKQALMYDIEVNEERVDQIEKKDDHFLLKVNDHSYETGTVLLATGTEWKKLEVPGEARLTGNGVHYCALCDGYAYQDKTIAVIGGGDSAAKEALLLTKYARKVYIIYRREKIRSEPMQSMRVEENPKIEIINNANVIEIKGEKALERVVLDREFDGSNELVLDGIFVSIGHVPISQLVKDLGVRLDSKGSIKINRFSETNIPGIYAAGDVTDNRFKQAFTGAAEGVNAIYSAYNFLKNKPQ